MENKKPQLNSRFSFVTIQDFYKTFIMYEKQLLGAINHFENKEIPELVEMLKKANIKYEKPYDSFYMATPLVKYVSEYAVAVIVFAAFYLEGYIYQYATKHLSSTYFKKYLDKLSLNAKYVVIPELVTGKKMNAGSKAFQMLADLVSTRNGLAHPKPTRNNSSDYSEEEKEEFFDLIKNAHLAFRTIKEILEEIDKLENDGKITKDLTALFNFE